MFVVLFFDSWVNKNKDIIRAEKLDYLIAENESEMKLQETENYSVIDCGINGRKTVSTGHKSLLFVTVAAIKQSDASSKVD